MGSEAASARKCAVSALSASPARDFIHMHMTADLPDGLQETLEAHARLLLYEDAGSLEAQLNALCVPLSPTPSLLPPDPLPLPEETLRFVQAHGGWQEQADHYVLRLAPDEAPPCWHAVLSAQDVTSRHAPDGTALLMQSGASLCREYPLWLQTPEGCFPLLSPAAFRRVEVSPSQILWQCAGHGVDAALTASTVPDSRFHLRALRLKNLTTRPLSLTLTLAVDFGPCACPSTLPFGTSALRPDLPEPLYLAMPEHQPQVDIMSTAAFLGSSIVPTGLTAAPEDTGTLVRLTLPLTLKAGGNLTISWIIGMGSTIDMVESLLSHLRQQGISALLRQHQRSWAQQLSCLTVSTPEPALDLLLNHLLPCQALQPPTGPLRLLPLTDPEQARSAWLHATAMPDADLFTRLMMIFDLLAMIHCTGDPSILHQPAPHQPSLHFMCIQTLSSVQLGQHGLPLTAADALGVTESVLLGLMLLHALQRYTPFCSAEESADMLDTAQRLTQAIHQHGWDGAWYRRGFTATGLPIGSADTPWGKIDGMTQAWAYLALGDTPHTRQALNAAWQMLWDPAANVLHTLTPPFDMLQDPAAPTALPPGIGQNGGQDALTSVCMLQALIAAGQWDAAWMLLHALNPVTKPAAQVEPWLLPESWDAHGLALRPDDRGVCALLDRTALSGLLGFDLQGDMLFPAAHVPPSWAFFSLTLHRGTSTWHILFSRSEGLLTLDGTPISDGCIPLTNDGRIHQIRVPLPG